jgi:hypothetical protein
MIRSQRAMPWWFAIRRFFVHSATASRSLDSASYVKALRNEIFARKAKRNVLSTLGTDSSLVRRGEAGKGLTVELTGCMEGDKTP